MEVKMHPLSLQCNDRWGYRKNPRPLSGDFGKLSNCFALVNQGESEWYLKKENIRETNTVLHHQVHRLPWETFPSMQKRVSIVSLHYTEQQTTKSPFDNTCGLELLHRCFTEIAVFWKHLFTFSSLSLNNTVECFTHLLVLTLCFHPYS